LLSESVSDKNKIMRLSAINEKLEKVDHQSVAGAVDYIIDLIQHFNHEYGAMFTNGGSASAWERLGAVDYENLEFAQEQWEGGGAAEFDGREAEFLRRCASTDMKIPRKILKQAGHPHEIYVPTGHYFNSDEPEFSAELILQFTAYGGRQGWRNFSGKSGFRGPTGQGKPVVLLTFEVEELMTSEHLDSHLDSLKKGITRILYHEIRHITQKFLQIQKSGRSHKTLDAGPYIGNPHEVDAEAAALARLYLALPPEDRKPFRSMNDLIKMIGGDKASEHFMSQQTEVSARKSSESVGEAQMFTNARWHKILSKVMKLVGASD
jgi:hypothetical protein